MDVRPIIPECQDNTYECQDINPEGIIYCLNIFEYSTKVQSAVRCLSIWDIDLKNVSNIVTNKKTVEVLRQVQSNYCTQKLMKQCNCSSCTIEPPLMTNKILLENKINVSKKETGHNSSHLLPTNIYNGKINESKEILIEEKYNNKDKIPNFLIFKYAKKLFNSIFNNNNSSSNYKWNISFFALQYSFLFLILVNKIF